MRVALYGGSFDPPHIGHTLLATHLLCRAEIDALQLIPVASHAFGKHLTAFDDRRSMIEATFAHLGPAVSVNPIEADLYAANGGTPTYMVDTVRAIKAAHPDWDLVLPMGTDLYATRARWKDWDALMDRVELVVIGRDGIEDPPGLDIPVHLPEISSSDIRARVRAGLPISGFVAPPVAAFIAENGLYQVTP